MSHSSYTASERRGILVIAILSLLIIACGIGVSWINQNKAENEVAPQVFEHAEMVDTTVVKVQGKNKEVFKQKAVKSSEKENKKTLNKKVYRRRNPLDEPV